jgi:hypothetical protein
MEAANMLLGTNCITSIHTGPITGGGKSSGAPEDEFRTDDASIPICIVGAGWMSVAI